MGRVGLILQVRPYFCHFRCEFPTPLLADRQIPSLSLVQEGEPRWREDRAVPIPQEAQRFVPLWEQKDEAWDSGCSRFITSPPIGLEFPVLILLTFSKNQLLVSSISLLFFSFPYHSFLLFLLFALGLIHSYFSSFARDPLRQLPSLGG